LKWREPIFFFETIFLGRVVVYKREMIDYMYLPRNRLGRCSKEKKYGGDLSLAPGSLDTAGALP
jgi:hypothetical protein